MGLVMRFVRSVLAAVLVGSVVLSFSSWAEGSSKCVEGYRKANGAYFEELGNLKRLQGASQVGVFVGLGGGVACAVTRKSLAGVLLCGVAGAVIAVPAGYATTVTAAEVDRMQKNYQLEDFYLTYQAYFTYRTGFHGVSKEAMSLVGSVIGISTDSTLSGELQAKIDAKSTEVLETLKTLMESGVLCDGGDTPQTSLKNVIELIRGKIEVD